MKENKGTTCNVNRLKYTNLQQNNNNVVYKWVHREAGSDFAGQIDNKRESIACGVPGSLFEGDDKQIYNCHGARSSTNVGCGAVKAMPRRKVRKIYLPETDEIGVGVSDISLDRKIKNSQQNYVSTWTTSKCVGSFEINTNSEKERLAPVKYVSHATSSPIGGVHTEMAINTVPTRIAYASTQVEVEIEDKSNCKTYSTIETDTAHLIDTISKQIQYNKESAIIVTKGAPKPEHTRIVSSDSLVNIYNLEECDPQNKVLVDPMENKMEMEYRKIFSPHPTKQDSNGGSNSSNSNSKLPDKSASILRRRFEALRKGLSKKEDAKRESVEHSSQGSTASHKDASITSDPPSLECKSFTNTEKCIPYEAETNDHDIAEENELESQGAKGMFKLWGKKFNLEDDSNKKIEVIESTRKSSEPDNSVNSPSIEYSLHTPSTKFSKQNHPSILKSQIVEKNTSNNTSAQSSQKSNKKEQDGNKPKKFFFFKKKTKSKNKEQSFSNPCSTKKVTAGRCEIKNDMTLSLKNYGQSPKIHMTKITEDDDLSKKPWLKRLMSNTLESARSVNVRWNNSMYATSSSTMFELIDTVYKNSNICRSSKSDTSQTPVNKCKPHIAPKPRHFARDIEAWMIPQTIIDNPQNLPIECYTKSINYYDTQDTAASKNIEVTISDQKWVIEKGRAVSHKIEVVLHTNNTFMANKKSSEYLRIDIPKDFFDITSSDSKRSQFSDEEVFNIVEYETDNTKHDDKPLYSGDHSSDIKVIVSVKSCKNEESTVIEKIVKRQPLRRDVLTQKSEVFVQKKCDVIGVGIITQRDLKEYHKSIRQEILEAESESVSEEDEIENHTGMTEKKCEFAESYLQDYYKHWAPGLDSYSWCLSDPLLVSASDKSLMSLLRQTDISKSCPNIGETSTLVSSAYGTSSCSIIDNKMILEKFKQLTNAEAAKYKEEADNKRILPKDSLEVFKRRKIYSQSLKSQWINDVKASSKSVPSLHNKSLKDTQDREKDPDSTIACIMKGRKRVSMPENETKRKESEGKKCTVIRFSKHPFVQDEPEIISLSSSSLQNRISEDKIPEISSKSAFSTTSNSSFTVMKLKSPRKSLKSMWVPPKKDKPKCLTCGAQTGRSVTNSNISVRTLLSSETNECHSSKRRFAVSNIKDSLKSAISGSKCKLKCRKCSNTRLAGTRPICSECFSRESFTKSIRESKHKHHRREKKSKQKKSSNSHVGLYLPIKPTICTKCRAPLKYDKNNPKNAICPFCDLISPKQSKLLSKTNAVLKKCSQSLKMSSSLFNRHNNTETRCCKNCKNSKKDLSCSKCENNCKNTDSSQIPSSKSSAKSQLSVRYDIKKPDSKKTNSNANQPTRIKPNSVPPPPCMKPSSELTPPCMKSSSVLTPPCQKSSSVQTPPYQKPSAVQTPPCLKPSLVKPPPCQKPSVVKPPPSQKPCPMQAQPSGKLSPVKPPPCQKPCPMQAQPSGKLSPVKPPPCQKPCPMQAQPNGKLSPVKAQPSPITTPPSCKSSPVNAQESPMNVQPCPGPRVIKAVPSPNPSSIKPKPATKCKSCPKCKNPLKYEVNNPERVLCPLCDLKSVESQEFKKEQTESGSNKCPICNKKLLFGDICPVCEPDKPPEKTPVRSCCPGCQLHKDIPLPKKPVENKTQNGCCPACKYEYNNNMGLYPLSSNSSTSDGSDSSCPKCKTKKYNKVIESACPRCTNDAPQPKPEDKETDKQKYCPKCKTGLKYYASRNQVICEFCTSSSSSDDFINKALNQKSETGSTQMIFQPPITYDRNSSNEARCVVCANSSQSVIDIIRSRLKQTCVPKTCPLCNNPLKIDYNDSVIIKCRHLCKNRPDEADNKIEDSPRGKNSKEKLTKKLSKEKGSSDGTKEKSASEKGSTHQINKVSIEDDAVKKKKKDSVEKRRTCCPNCLDSPRKGICSHCGAQAKETKEKEKQGDCEPNLPQPASNMCSICKNIMKAEFNGICPKCAKPPVLNSGTSNSVTESDEEPKVKKSLFKIKLKKTLPTVCPNCSYPLNEKISDSKKNTKQDKKFKKDKKEDGAKGKPVKLKVKRDSLIVNKRQQEAKHKPEENSSSGILKSSSTSTKECPCASRSDDCVCLIGDSMKPVNKKNITDEAEPPKLQCACQDVEKTPEPKVEEECKPEGNSELETKSSSQTKIICKCKKSKSETKVQNSNSNFTISFAKVSKKTTSFEDSSLFEEKVNAITQYVEQRNSGMRCESDGSGCPCGRRSNLSRSDISRELVMRTNRQKQKSGSAKRHKSKSDRHCLPHKKEKKQENEHCGSECKKRRDTSECEKACIRKKKRDTPECMKDKTPPCKRPKSASPYSSVEDCKSKRRCRKSRDKSAPEGLKADIMEDKNKDCHKHKHYQSTKCSDIAFSILRKRDSYGSVTINFTPKHSKTKSQERHRSKIQPDEHCVNVFKKKKDITECEKDDKPDCKEREDTPECQKDPIPVCKRPPSDTESKKPKPCKCAEKTSSHSLCKKTYKQKKDCNTCNDIITVNTSSNPVCKKAFKSQECNELKSVAVDNLSLHSLGKTPSQCKPEACSKPKTPSKSLSSHSICKKTCKPEEPISPPSIKTSSHQIRSKLEESKTPKCSRNPSDKKSSHLTGKLTCQSEECSKPRSIPATKTSSHSLRIKTNSKDKECNKAKPIPDAKVSSHSLCESCKKGHKAKQGSKRLKDAAELQSPKKSQSGLLVRECSDALEKGRLKYEPCYMKEVPASKRKTSDGSKTKHGSRKHRHHSGSTSKSKKDAVEMSSSVQIVLSGAKMPTLNTANTNKPKTCQCQLCEKMSAKQSLPKQVCLECDSSLFPHSNRCSKTKCSGKNQIAPYNNTPEVDKQCRCVVEKSSVVSPVNLVDHNSTATTDKTKVRLDVTSSQSKSTKKKLPLLIDWGKSSLKELKSEIKSALKSPLFSKKSINRNIKTSNRNSESIMKKLYENEFIIPSVEDPKTSQLKNEKHKVRHLPLCESLRNKLEKLKSMTNSAMKENYPWPLNNQNSVTQPNFTETLKCKSDKDIPKRKHDLVKKTSSTLHDEKLSDISYDLEDSNTISMIKKHCMAKYGLKNVSNSDSSTNAVIITSDDAPSNIETTATTKAANSYTRQWVSNNSEDSDDKQTKKTRKPKAKESFLNRNRSLTSSILRKLRQKKPPDSQNELKIRLSSQKLPNMNFSVLDEDGDVIFERKEYSKGKRRHSVLEDMYKGSDISRMSAQAVIQNVVTDAQSETAGSDKSEATDDNTIEIQLKIVVGNSTETFKTSEHTVRGQQFSACALTIPTKSDTEKYIKCDNDTASKTSNDINIKIVIKNFKSDKKQDEEHSISTTSKVNTVLTKYGDVYDQKVDKTYSVHRAAINRSSTNVKSSVNGFTMDRVENAEDTYTLNSENTVDSTFNTENTQNITIGGAKEDVLEIKSKNRSKTRVQWAENTLKISDEKDKISEEPTEEIKILASIEEKSSKSSSLKERKEMLKKVMAKATSKPKNKALVRELTDMLKIILTDSSDNELQNSALLPTNDGIISTESDGFYGTKTITACKIESNISSLRDSGPGSALEYKTFITTDSNSEESKIFKGCMCSKFLKKLSDSKSNLRCCCKLPSNQKDQETICVSLDEDTDSTKYCDAEIQNSIVISSTDENEKMNMSIKSFMTSITSYEKTVQNAIITKKRVEKTISKNKSYKEQRVRKLISSQIKTEFKESNTNLPKVSKFTRKSQKKRLPKPSEVLQCYETKKAVLEIYAEESPSLAGAHLVARLPKFVYGTGSEITRNYQAMASLCDQGYIVY